MRELSDGDAGFVGGLPVQEGKNQSLSAVPMPQHRVCVFLEAIRESNSSAPHTHQPIGFLTRGDNQGIIKICMSGKQKEKKE